jgi:hypothetical protein
MRLFVPATLLLFMVWSGNVCASPFTEKVFKVSPYIEAANAIEAGDNAKLEKLIKQPGFDINYETPVVNLSPGRDSFTLLDWAISEQQAQAVEILLKAAADPNKATHSKTTPLMLAALGENDEIFKILLVRYGANPNKTDDIQVALTIVLGIPSINKPPDFNRAELLVKHGADVNIVFGRGKTPIIDAAIQYNYPAVLWLLEHRANYEARDHLGWTMLCRLRDSYTNTNLKPSSEIYKARDNVRDWLLAHGVARSRIDPKLHPSNKCDD